MCPGLAWIGGDVEEEEGKIEQIKREVLSAVSDKGRMNSYLFSA